MKKHLKIFKFLLLTLILCSTIYISVFASEGEEEHIHNYGNASFKKQSDGTWTATFYCLDTCNHSVTVDANATVEITKPTCTKLGKRIYYLSTEFNGTTYEQTRDENIPALGHDFSNGPCSRCGEKQTAALEIASSKSFIYDGEPHTVELTTQGDTTGAVTYHHYLDKNCTKETTPDNSGASENGAAPVLVGRYYVRATSAEDDNYKETNSSVCTINIKPLAVEKLTVVNHKDGIKITWSRRKADYEYTIYRRTASGEYHKIMTIDEPDVTSYMDKNPTGGNGKYFYNITVSQKGSNGYPVTSNKRSAAKQIHRAKLTITNNISSVKLKWSYISGASGYYIYRKTKGQDKYYKIKTIKDVDTLTWKDSTEKAIVNGRKSSYYVKAYFKKSNSAITKTATTTNYFLSRPKPWADGRNLDWATNKYADGYTTEKIGQERPYYNTKNSIVKDFWPKNNTTYKGRVKAYKYVNGVRYESAWSQKVSCNPFKL